MIAKAFSPSTCRNDEKDEKAIVRIFLRWGLAWVWGWGVLRR